MKYVYALLLMSVFHTSCVGQNNVGSGKDNIKSETKDTVPLSYDPNRMVRNVKKGRDGTILIAASRSGVFRYNGKSFTNLTNKIGLRRYWDVLADRRGNLWVGTTDSGVYHYNGNSFQHFTTREGLANNAVLAIYEDRAGNIWFGTGGGVSRYNGTSFQNFTTKEGLPNSSISTIMEDKTGKLWFGTRGEAFFMMEKHLPFSETKTGRPLPTFGR
jgi:ligand-binding sensor domain-containing protein